MCRVSLSRKLALNLVILYNVNKFQKKKKTNVNRLKFFVILGTK